MKVKCTCPYCGTINEFGVKVRDYIAPALKACSVQIGGCGDVFVLSIDVVLNATTEAIKGRGPELNLIEPVLIEAATDEVIEAIEEVTEIVTEEEAR